MDGAPSVKKPTSDSVSAALLFHHTHDLEESNPAANMLPCSCHLTSVGHGKRTSLYFTKAFIVINNNDHKGKGLLLPTSLPKVLLQRFLAMCTAASAAAPPGCCWQGSEGTIALKSTPLTAGHHDAAGFLLVS